MWNTPKLYQTANLKDFRQSLRSTGFEDSLYVQGPCGTGKTHFMFAMIHKLVEEEKRTVEVIQRRELSEYPADANEYIQYWKQRDHFMIVESEPSLYTKIKSNFGKSKPMFGDVSVSDQLMTQAKYLYNQEDVIINRMINTQYLFLDDMDAGNITSYTKGILYQIINGRYLMNRFTFISSNTDLNDIGGGRNEELNRIASRLVENYRMILFSGNDLRKKKQKTTIRYEVG